MATVDLGNLKNAADKRQPIEVEAAFMVIIREGGVIQASPDINAPIVPRRPVTLEEMQSASQRVVDDIQATKIASIVQQGMQQAASMAMQRASDQRLVENLNL